jgi:exodeoxyribonuclease V beta subunit
MNYLEPDAFDACGELPAPGITVLEASAGTGKTFTISALVTRFVAQGVPLGHILAVTFTRMATGELRDRVRRQLVNTEDHLARYLLAGETIPTDDEITAHLAREAGPTIDAMHQRLADAVAGFDSATIATTHGFCQLVLDGLGSAGDVAAGATLVEDPADLIEEIVDDLYVRRCLLHGPPPFSRDMARMAATRAVGNPGIELAPPASNDPDGLLTRLVTKTHTEVARRLQDDNLLTYDHLLARLADTLEDPERGPVACRRLRQRYRVVLVDEFQDTDPVQWTIVRTAFGDGGTILVLVGDPKQAIYSFRGADVHAYLEAARQGKTSTLALNWRTDQPLLDATEALLFPLRMGHDDIQFRSVNAPPDHQQTALRDFPAPTPIRIRLVDNDHPDIRRTNAKQLLHKPSLVDWIAGDVARDIARLLDSGGQIRTASPADPADPAWRPVAPTDIGVLTKTNRQSIAVREALRAAGVPAVIAGIDSIFASDAATHWLRLLEALEEPASRSRAVAVALTPFIGMTVTEVATAGERSWENVHARAHRWSALLAGYGVAALYRSITATEGLPARVVATVGGERELTDLGHIAELLHAESAASQMGVPTLRAWLAQRVAEVDIEQLASEERSRRLDSDAEAVQVLTVHRAKGLEFGVVYCPYLWDAAPAIRAPEPVVFHDPDNRDVRTLDVGSCEKSGPAWRRYTDHRDVAMAEQRGEDLRLMYVAVTRARHQVVAWWGRADHCRNSPLGRLLLCRDTATGAVRDAFASDPKDKDVRAALDALLARTCPGLIAVESAGNADTTSTGSGFVRVGGPADPLEAARFERELDLRWRRASYTSITAAAHDGVISTASVGSEPERPGLDDEPSGPEGAGGPAAGASGVDGSAAAGGPAAGATGSAGPAAGGGGLDGPPSAAGGPATAGDGQAAGSAGDGASAGGSPISPWGGIPGGTEVGTFVHALLEKVDFAASDLSAEVDAAMRATGAWGAGIGGGSPAFGEGLAAALTTPLGSLLPGVCLRDIARRDRADELSFELPLVGGDHPTGQVSTADIAAVLGPYLREGGPLAGYARRLMDPLLATTLRGYLTGSLDLVFRRSPGDGPARWYVADYKTNWLGEDNGPLTAWHYRPTALDAEMQRRHYPLQALLYLVALHRYLRWRLPEYAPEVHLGGVFYLFLRGMVGPDTPAIDRQTCGVFSWAPPADLIVGLSDLFGNGPTD